MKFDLKKDFFSYFSIGDMGCIDFQDDLSPQSNWINTYNIKILGRTKAELVFLHLVSLSTHQ
jgi:hypothetical protein